MENNKNIKLVVAITGASGSIYAKVLLDNLVALKEQIESVGLVFSNNAKTVWEHELGNKEYKNYPFKVYEKMDFFAPFASGSANYNAMIICPASMGTIARIAQGVSNDLVTRSADVMLKERRKLIVVPRETPYSLIHLKNLKTLTEAGAVVCPATPSFYSNPSTFEELAMTVISRILDLTGFQQQNPYRWGDS